MSAPAVATATEAPAPTSGALALTPEGFAEVQKRSLEKRIEIYPARSWYPSSAGHPCDRYQVWRMTRWQKQAPHDHVLQSIFDQGRDCQPLIYRRLEEMGFDVVRESDRPTQYTLKNGARISGRPDGKIRGYKGERYASPRILEAKSMSGFEFDRMNTVDDLRNAERHWTRSYYAQGQLYTFLEDLPLGVFVLYSKATGMLKLIPYELDLGYAETILARIERLQELVNSGAEPEPIPFVWGVCGGCGFLDQCFPARDFGEGASVIEDTVLVEQLERRAALQPATREYEALDKEIKTRLKHDGIKQAIAGPFVIEGQERSRKEYTVKASKFVAYSIERQA